MAEFLAIAMFATVCGALIAGFRVAIALAGTALIFAAIGVLTGSFDAGYLLALPGRIFPLITRDILMAVPLFIFMGVMLEKSRLAEDLLASISDLFGPLRGGLGIAVILVGALLAASTGIVGATVVTMGLMSLPTMLDRGYSKSLSTGAIAASGTLGQIIPPSIVLVILGDQLSTAYNEAQRRDGFIGEGGVVSVGDLFAGALLPGLILVGLYAAYIAFIALIRPAAAPPVNWPDDVDNRALIIRALKAIIPPILLIVAVLGSILSGYATPTSGAALGALGAILLAAFKLGEDQLWLRRLAWLAAAGTVLMVTVDLLPIDTRLGQESWTAGEIVAASVASIGALLLLSGTALACWRLIRDGIMGDTARSTLQITSMVFVILIGATIFSLVFRGFGGDELVEHALMSAPGGTVGALILVMIVMFVLGFFLDFIEITFVVVPLVAPILLASGIDPVWLGILMALNLQTSFLTPPFGFALFYLRGVAPPEIATGDIYRGALPFIGIQIFVLGLVAAFPSLATGLG